MTHNSLLDAILSSYLYGLVLKLQKSPDYKKLSFKLIAKAQDPTIDEWNIEFLKKQLFDDGFLEYAKYGEPEPFELTPAGIKAAQTRWYSSQEEEKRIDKQIKDQTLLSLKRSSVAKTISIWAIVVPTIISLVTLWLSFNGAKSEEVNSFKEQLKKMQLQQIKTEDILRTIQSVPFDTAKAQSVLSNNAN